MKDYMVFIKDCINRLFTRLHIEFIEFKEQPIKDIRRVSSEYLSFHADKVICI